MSEPDLPTLWTVLQTEATGAETSIETVASGASVSAGDVLVGVDGWARRHILIPMRPGEAFAEDRSGRAVHLVRVTHEGTVYLSAVCLQAELNQVFAQFARELITEIAEAVSPARATVASLARWRSLFSEADRTGVLSEARLIGVLAELLTLEALITLDPSRRLSVWTGPSGSQHDFRAGGDALEVKATLIREGRIVGVSSVDQLQPPDGGALHLLHHRFQADPSGESLPGAIAGIRNLGVEEGLLLRLLHDAGYRSDLEDHYAVRRYRLVDRRCYDVELPPFPRIVASSFVGASVPAGTLRLSYSIDLTNEPPHPLDEAATTGLLNRMAVA